MVGRDQGPAGPGRPGRPGAPPARPAVPSVHPDISSGRGGLSTELDLGAGGRLRLFESTAEIDRTLSLLHTIEITTPTGHTYRSTAPPLAGLRHPAFRQVDDGRWVLIA